MIERTAQIRNNAGIHCRPSAVIIKAVQPYPGMAKVSTENGEATLHSIMGLLSLCLEKGTRVRITVDGPEEQSFAEELVKLFETEYDFPPRDEE